MREQLPLFPENASTIAGSVDSLYFFLVAVTAFFSIVIFTLVFVFAIKYRRRSPDEVPRPIIGSLKLELFWSITPFFITMVMFVWGTTLFFRNFDPPPGAMEIYVVGKQWMWKLQHPEGQTEINELHVPVGRPVKLTMATEDVIHSFYVPAFRTKKDVVPGQFSTLWFTATKPGKYHLFCAEYCGNQHSGMIGWVHVMEPAAYERWLGGGAGIESMATTGERLFQRYGCGNCHRQGASRRGPLLDGVFGRAALLQGGARILVDESYLRESILNPSARLVAGYPNVMPTFQGQLSEEGLLQVIAYIKSLARPEDVPPLGAPPNPGGKK